MAKFCGNCGTQLDDDARICGQCGTPYAGDNNMQKIPGVNKMSAEKKKKIKLFAKLGVAAIALVIVVVLAVNIISSFTGYKGVINKAMKAFENYDIDTLLLLTSDISYEEMDETELEDSFSQFVSAQLDELEAEAGHDMSLSYEILDSHELSERKNQAFMEYIEDTYDYDSSGISEVRAVKIRVTAKGSLGEESTVNNDLYLIKENGEWYLYSGYIGTSN